MDLTFIIMLAVMALVFFALNSFTKRSNQKRTDERDRMLREDLTPGAWVHTSVGFYGRFVDLDGDVLILETPGGVETYWNKAVVRTIGDLPFEAEDEFEESVDGGEIGEISDDSTSEPESSANDQPDHK